ncbi:MAG: RNA-binding protein [Burkholderiales bacterium]|nr:MAG: RNA-binding protein [Burkholderiales bacterium]
MASLWLVNLPADVTDDEIDGWLQKYGFPPCDEILRVPGDGSRPGAVVSFADLDEQTLRRLQPRVDGVFVRDRAISAQVAPPPRREPR